MPGDSPLQSRGGPVDSPLPSLARREGCGGSGAATSPQRDLGESPPHSPMPSPGAPGDPWPRSSMRDPRTRLVTRHRGARRGMPVSPRAIAREAAAAWQLPGAGLRPLLRGASQTTSLRRLGSPQAARGLRAVQSLSDFAALGGGAVREAGGGLWAAAPDAPSPAAAWSPATPWEAANNSP